MSITPGLDDLTRQVKEQFRERVATPEFSLRLTEVQIPRVRVTDYLRSGEARSIGSAVRELHRINSDANLHLHRELRRSAVRATATETSIDAETKAALFDLVRAVEAELFGLVVECLKSFGESDVSIILVELYRMDEREFDPDIEENALDYNADDAMPSGSDTPHDNLTDLMANAVIARLMKNYGRELLLSWVMAARV